MPEEIDRTKKEWYFSRSVVGTVSEYKLVFTQETLLKLNIWKVELKKIMATRRLPPMASLNDILR